MSARFFLNGRHREAEEQGFRPPFRLEVVLAKRGRSRVKTRFEPNTLMKTDSPSNLSYRWLKPEHGDLLFWGMEPLPWPTEDEKKIDPKADFPFHRLLKGIERLRAGDGAGVGCQMGDGEDLPGAGQ